MGEISHRILKIGGLTIISVVTVLIFGISYATLCIIIPAASGTVYLSQKEYSYRRIRQAAAVHGRRMRNLGVLERQREWKHRSSTVPTDRTLQSSSTQPNKLSAGFSHAVPTLPRMRRLNSPSSSYSSPLVGSAALNRTIMTAQRRHPLAQYSNMSILPIVHLDQPSRHILSERNSRMVGSAVTVKIAPPDVLKPPTPVLLHVGRKMREPEYDPCDTSTVLTAIREKRKRTLKEEEVMSPTTDWTQASKRRRQEQGHTANGDGAPVPNGGIGMDMGPQQLGAQKRTASTATDSVTDDERTAKRSRQMSGETHGVRNPIDVSYSSSRRWFDRKARERSVSQSRASSVMSSGSRDTGPQYMSDCHSGIAGSSGTSTPRRSYGLSDDDDEEMGSFQRSSSAADDIVRQTCARLAGHSNGQESAGSEDGERERARSKRTTPIPRRYDVRPPSSLVDSIVKVPRLRYDLTVEDYAADRQAEVDRVKQMLSGDADEDSGGVLPGQQPSVQPTSMTATPIKSLFANSLTSVTSTGTNHSTSSGFVLPSMSQPKTSMTVSGALLASVPTNAASSPVSTAASTANTLVPDTASTAVSCTTTNSFSAGQCFTSKASVPDLSKHSFGASKSFGVTTSAPSSATSAVSIGSTNGLSSGTLSSSGVMSSGVMSGGVVSSGATTSKSPPTYSFKPVFSVQTPPKTDATQPTADIDLNTRTPTLETMLRSESPAKTLGGNQMSMPASSQLSQPLFSAASSSGVGPHTQFNTMKPSVAPGSQPLVNGSTDMFKLAASTPTVNFGAPKKDLTTSTAGPFGFSTPVATSKSSAPLLATSTAATAASNNTFQFGAPPFSSASVFGAGSTPVLNNVSPSGSVFGQNTPVSATKTGSGVAKSLFGNAAQPGVFSGASTASAGGATFTFGTNKPDSVTSQPASVFGVAPAVNGTADTSAFLPPQIGSTTSVTFGTVSSSAPQSGVFQFGGAPKASTTPRFTPVFNFQQEPVTQASQPTPFGSSVNTSQSSASFATPFKGFGQNSTTFGVDNTKTPTATSGIFGAPTSTAPFGGSANTFGATNEMKPFGASSPFGSFGGGPTQSTTAAPPVNIGATAAANTGFQFGGSTSQGVFTFGQGQQNTAGNAATPTFGSSSTFPAPSFTAQPPGGNMFSLTTPVSNRPRAMGRPGRRRGARR